jgi:hypothetical protein
MCHNDFLSEFRCPRCLTAEPASRPERKPALVFISYASQPDQTTAEQVVAALEAAGIACWIASRDIGVGDNYAMAIVNAIENCKIALVLLSTGANRSPHVANEIERAVNYRKDIVPIRLENVAPSRAIELHLATRQWIDLFDQTKKEENMARLMDALRDRLREWLVPDLPPLPPRADETPVTPPPSVPEPRVTPGGKDESGTWILYVGRKEIRGRLQNTMLMLDEQDTGLRYEMEPEKISEITVLLQHHQEKAAPCWDRNIAKIKLNDGQILSGCLPFGVVFVSGATKVMLNNPEKADFKVVRRK